jgi:predicted GIY-YIG superfamily endonuclease
VNVAKINPLELPSLPLNERSNLPSCPAIYFVMQGKRVLYIGKTVNLAQRWAAHHKWSYLVKLDAPVRIAWLICSDTNLLTQIEKALIKEFAPQLNGKNYNPDYSQITGLIPKALAQRFRVYCVENEVQLTEALEIAIQEFLDKRQNQPSSTEKHQNNNENP